MIAGSRAARRLRAITGTPGPGRRLPALLADRPRLAVTVAAVLAAVAGAVPGGPVAGVVAGAYTALAVHTVVRRDAALRTRAAEAALLDEIASAAADLRAGQPGRIRPAAVVGASTTGERVTALVRQRVDAAFRVGHECGAPLADLLDRLVADLRAGQATAAQAAAQAAGVTATSWLLTLLPVAGVALGYALGVDPAAQLLHTRLGAGCVLAALALQFAGLAWVHRILRAATEVAG